MQGHQPESIEGIALTGYGGERLSKALNAYYVNEVIAQDRSAANCIHTSKLLSKLADKIPFPITLLKHLLPYKLIQIAQYL